MTIGKAINSSKLPQTETEILLANILGKDRSFVNSFSETKLTRNQKDKFTQFTQRRLKSEPLAYILGYREFFGLNFLVNKHVLIPRAETENLVEAVLSYTKNSEREDLKLIDVGTGSGAIAISVAVNNPSLSVIATDISPEALKVAVKNARLHQVHTKIKFLKSDLLENLKQKVDIIAANLPYIPTKKYNGLPEEIRLFEPKLALDSGESDSSLYQKLFLQAREKLKPKGVIFYEIDGDILSLRNSQFS